MSNRLELTWIGKYDPENKINPEPRILIEKPEYSYSAKTKEADEQNEDFDNLLIHGDNLLALKALEFEYSGKVRCIMIDPPYNTKSAFTHYDDNLEHSTWLNLMKPRLELLKRLLSEDGSIWISLNEDELAYLKVLCDEVFGRSNFKTMITWQRKYSVSNNFKGIASLCDYILVYSKSSSFVVNLLPRTEESKARYNNPDNDPRGPWKSVDYLNQATPQQRPNLCYDIINPNNGQIVKNTTKAWKYEYKTHQIHVKENRLWWGADGNASKPSLKLFLSEVKDGMTPHNWWPHDEAGHTDEAKKEMIALFGAGKVFDTPKPERLIQRIITLATNPGDLVLDSFLGSGTTAAVAHKMGRRWIGIELGNHAYTHCYPRLKAVIDGEQGGISKSIAWKGGGSFKFYELAPTLIKKDKYGNNVISDEYNAEMLAQAMAKHEGYTYLPDETYVWKQGFSGDKNYIFTTTSYISSEYLDYIASELPSDVYLLICADNFEMECVNRHKNITIHPIPKILLGRCEFGKDNYNLNMISENSREWEDETND